MKDAAKTNWVLEIGDMDFDQEVVERSMEVPVVVDFWAPWCGPCRMLGPLLETEAKARNGQFVLAKINIDEHSEVAGYFQVSGIPAIRVIRDKKLIDGFDGATDEQGVKELIDRILPNELDRIVQQAKILESMNPTEAEANYRSILENNSELESAKIGLARVLVNTHRDEEASTILNSLGVVDEIGQEAERLRRVIEVRKNASNSTGDETTFRKKIESDPENAQFRFELGSLLATQEKYPEALEVLLSAAERDKQLAKNQVRELMVKIFQIIGVRSELADSYRDQLQRLLY